MKHAASDPFRPGAKSRCREPAEQLPILPTPEEIEAAAAVLADWRAYPTHLKAARALGVSLATLAHWKEQSPRLRAAWDKAAPLRMLVRRKPAMVGINVRGERVAMPDRQQASKVAAALLHEVKPGVWLTEAHERRACEQTGMSWEDWQEARRRWPKLMRAVYRQRRWDR